ncbi:MAG TPA: alpha-L-rhamnosidase C-terminal domain-containing protein [Chitinophagaceae bacterium]|nr:alpha-L-rhamnosidase C-terminal domain-containing protein [Chitinophagaceae bacterium]
MLPLFFAACIISSHAQNINPSVLNKQWDAFWITAPDAPAKDYGVYFFRKNFELADKPATFVVHVSGDNRYKLFVNGNLVSLGPARGDLYYWNFETVDIAAFLKPGKNTVAAIVWNDGDIRPEGQISNRTGFVLQANSEKEALINTNDSWKCMQSKAFKPIAGIGYAAYYVAGPGEFVNMNNVVQNWMTNDYDDSKWNNASQIGWGGASPKGIGDINGWMMVPSPLPQMELKVQRFYSVRKATGAAVPANFPAEKKSFTVAANTHAEILIDQSFLTDAYPTFIFSKGKNAEISIGYSEALFDTGKKGGWFMHKGNRNEVEGKVFLGRKDSIISNGSENQNFTTLSWRTFRYVQLIINTKDEALTIENFYNTFTGYPFQFNATFNADDADMKKMLEIGWRTARSCAVETYMDCPYYEQLQYIGDTRIQALVSLYNSGDDRLVRNAINQMDHSRIAEGITLSRHPSFSPQQIPTFSLWYIGMLHDYWMYRGDSSFVADKLQGVRNVLWFFSKYQQADGSLKNVPYWLFTDWVENRKGWDGGNAPAGNDGSSSVLDMQLLWALQLAAELEMKLGSQSNAVAYKNKAAQLQNTIRKKYWDSNKKLFADTDDKDLFSQHANTLAILTNTITGSDATALAKKILADESLAPASIYFKYYLHIACVKAGLGNDYMNWLGIWKQNMSMGLTTWAEMSNVSESRSDCHAWGASPNIEFFRTILGIDSDAPGFAKVKIEPHLGTLTNISGSIPHPNGTLAAGYQLQNGKWKIQITLPKNTTGYLLWKQKKYALKPGENNFELI